MTTYYKAVREDYTDFRTGTIRYDVGTTVTHPDPHSRDASGYLSVSVSPTDCTGFRWPCRLLVVEPANPWTPNLRDLPNKRACLSLLVVREVDAHEALGPQGREVAALIERARRLTATDAARDAAWAATLALIVRDLIGQHGFTQANYDALTHPWASVIGPVHPDDKAVTP